MKQINVHAAKTHLSRLLEEVAAGEEFVIAKAGKPYARLVGMAAVSPAKKSALNQMATKLKGLLTETDFDRLTDFPETIDAPNTVTE
jgi:prevent-host-death family protein